MLQHPHEVQTTTKSRPGKEKKTFSFIHCTIQKDTKRQSLQRLSIALASHLLFSHDSDPPTPGISPVPTGDNASLGNRMKPCASSQEARPVTADILVQKTKHMLFKTLKLAPVKHHSGGHFLKSHQDRGCLILELKAAPECVPAAASQPHRTGKTEGLEEKRSAVLTKLQPFSSTSVENAICGLNDCSTFSLPSVISQFRFKP